MSKTNAEMQIESTLFHTGDLVIFQADSSFHRHPVEIEAIHKGMVFIQDPFPTWLVPKEFAEKKPVIVGRVEKRWWGKKRILS